MIQPHSATVSMVLRADGQALPVAQMGPDFIILKSHATDPIAAGQGVITLSVDGALEEIPVTLATGISPGIRRVTITEQAPALATAAA